MDISCCVAQQTATAKSPTVFIVSNAVRLGPKTCQLLSRDRHCWREIYHCENEN